MSLALATLVYEWRRYLPAIIALALSGLMVLAQVGLFTGMVHSVLATVERSRADLYITDTHTHDLVQGWGSLPARVTPQIYLNPQVVEVATAERGGGQWDNKPAPGAKKVETFVSLTGLDLNPTSVTLPIDYTDAMRTALMEPMAVAIDDSTLTKLGVKLGDRAVLNGHNVRVRVILHNYQDLQRTDVIMSRESMNKLSKGTLGGMTGPLMVKIKDPAKAMAVRDQLNAVAHGAYRAWTKTELNTVDEGAVMKIQIVGMLLGASVVVAILIGIGITSQTLRGAILSNIKEFAGLRALGISMGALRLIIVELSAWVGAAGLLAMGGLTYLIAMLAASRGLQMVFYPSNVAWVCVMLMSIAVISGAMAMGVLKKSQPADLLR